MLRLVETKEPRPEHSTVINWTVPVYIKNGEDYYKVCFDIKRKPLPDGTLPLTKPELATFNKTHFSKVIKKVYIGDGYIYMQWVDMDIPVTNYKAILWLAERFELTSNN